MEVVAPESRVLSAILIEAGETIVSEALLATLTPGEERQRPQRTVSAVSSETDQSSEGASGDAIPMGPAVRALLDEHGLAPEDVSATGKGGRLLKEDVLNYLKSHEAAGQRIPGVIAKSEQSTAEPAPVEGPTSERVEKRVPMTRMRARIAERLLGATQQTAMLTTFNEVNMAPLMKLRKQYRDEFESVHNGATGIYGLLRQSRLRGAKAVPGSECLDRW